ncbi:hypothetical protein MMC27_007365 [Xylographa pallens]|nr:hypothetical protein [Xylographa pallens]
MQAPASTFPDIPISTNLSLEPPAVQAPNGFKSGYVSNSTESEELGGIVKIFETVNSTLSYVQFTTQNDSFLFTIGTPYLLCLSGSDGEGLIMSLDGTKLTYFAADGLDQQSYIIPSASVNGPARRNFKRQGSQLPVTVDIYDSCKNPFTLANIQVDCTPLLYAQTNAVAGPVAGQTVPGILSGNGAGEYTGGCDISSLLASNQMYQQCVTQSQHNLNVFCGLDQQVANNVKGFFEDLQKNVKEISEGLEEVSTPVFEALEDFQTKVGGLIERVTPALNFYKNFCDFVQNPIIVAEFNEEECGYPSQMSVAIEGTGFNVPLGAFSATPGAMVSTHVNIPASTACTTSSSSTASSFSTTSSSLTTSSSSTTPTTPTPTPALYTDQTGSCTPSQAYGKAVFCCSGGCIDGTSIGNPGQCEYWYVFRE